MDRPRYKQWGLEEHRYLGHTAQVDVYQHSALPNFFFVRWGNSRMQRVFFQRIELDGKHIKMNPHRSYKWINAVRAMLEMEGLAN